MDFTELLAKAPETTVRIPTEEGCRAALLELGMAPEAFLAGGSPAGILRLQTFEHVATHWVALAHVADAVKPLWVIQAWPKVQMTREVFCQKVLQRSTWWNEAR